MTSRTRSPHGDSAESPRDAEPQVEQAEQLGWADTPTQLRLALALAFLGAGLVVAGPVLGLVEDEPGAGFAATPLLVLVAIAAPVLATGLIAAGRALTAAAVLTGAALLAPGRALADLVFLDDGIRAARPEFLVPTSLAELTPAAGLWVLVGGHLAAMVAGGLAAGRAGARPGDAYALELDAGAAPVGSRGRAVGWALALGTVAVVGLVMPPFESGNAFLLDDDLLAAPLLARLGGLLIALAVLGGCVLAASSGRPAIALGVVLGVLAGTAAVTLPQIAAGLTVDLLDPTPGPYLALASLAVLAALVAVLRGAREREPAGTGNGNEVTLEAARVHLLTGALGVLTGAAALVGAFGPQLVVEGLDQPESYANRQLLPAGVLVAALGAALLHRRWAPAVRPAFVVSLGAVVLVGAATLDAAFTGSGIAFTGSGISAEISIGAGGWFAAAAVVLAAAAAVAAAIAGGTERDEVDLTERTPHVPVAAPVAAAILFAIGAFGLPMITAPDFTAPGIWSQFRLASWGLLIALLVVVGAAVLAAVARPARAAALLLGAAAVVGVHALELPLTGDRAQDATAGPGTWLSLACCLALLVAAGIASAGPGPDREESREQR